MSVQLKLNHDNIGLILTDDAAPMVKQLADRIASSAAGLAGPDARYGRDDEVTTRYRKYPRARSVVFVEQGGADAVDALDAAMKVAG